MKIEAIGKPICYRWPGGEIVLRPGQPVEVETERARRILAKLGSRVRSVGMPQAGECITWESPLFGLSSGEVLETTAEGATVFHPLTEKLFTVPWTWIRPYGEGR
ncbi:hypothetical protein YTPLAS18_17150 [Nitrospira sp.]|nr:hypothetical protein YTPLAS18_17150 [Nitrospira sp.]